MLNVAGFVTALKVKCIINNNKIQNTVYMISHDFDYKKENLALFPITALA